MHAWGWGGLVLIRVSVFFVDILLDRGLAEVLPAFFGSSFLIAFGFLKLLACQQQVKHVSSK